MEYSHEVTNINETLIFLSLFHKRQSYLQYTTSLKLIAHFISFRSNHSANVHDGVGLVVFHQENEGMIHIEQLWIPQLLSTKDAGVERVSIHIELHG